MLDFGQGGVVGAESFFGIPYKYKVADGSKIAGSIAIGKNTVARTGSVMLGDHSYTGKLGDIEIKLADAMTNNNGIYSTTLGAGAYNSGSLAAVTGALSIASGKGDKDARNTGATIYGSMNSIESATSNSEYSGVASSVLGFANRTQNANAALIWGTGNEVTNSVEEIGIKTNWNKLSVSEAQKEAIKAMQSNQYAGGSVMAIGGGNKADYAKYSQLTGVQNKVTGTAREAAKYDFVNGYKNTVTNASDVTVIGIKNEVTADGNKVIGDNHNVSGENNVIFGSADKLTKTTVNNSVVLGHNAKVTADGGIALGAGSVASKAAGELGYGADGKEDATWKATKGAVSVGGNGATRQITNVAAGTADTDAVNVAQLKKVSETAANANKGWKLKTKNGNVSDVKPGDTVDFAGEDNIVVSNTDKKVVVKLGKDLTGLNSVTTKNAYVTSVDASKDDSVTNVEYVKKQIADAALSAGDGISITDKKINVKLKEGEQNLVVDSNGLALNTALTGIQSITGAGDGAGSISFADGVIKLNNKVTIDNTGKITGVADGEISATSKDAVNGSQLHKVAAAANAGWNLSTNGNATAGTKVTPGALVDFSGDNNVSVSNKGTAASVKLNNALQDIESISNGDAKLALNGAAGTAGIINGQGASVYMQGSTTVINNKISIDKDGKISGVAAGKISADSTDAINGSQLHQTNENVAALDKRVTQNEADIAQNKADIAQNKADIATNKANIAQNAADIKKVEALAKKHTTVAAGDNITVSDVGPNADGGKEYKVALDKDINLDSVTTGQTVMNNDGLKVGKDVSVTATAVTAGKTSISDEGVKVGDKTYISADGLNANDKKVTNVEAGELSATSKDAVNGSQLYATNQEVANNTNRINKLGSRVNKVGAGAAALAALHPMDFDPDDKLTFSAGYGNYAGENAAAIGAYYRPDEKVMFSVAGTVGNGENMVNAGVSFALDRTNHVSNSRTALAREVIDLRGQLAVMGAKMAKMEKAFGMLDETKTKLFPDVPANHWAYEYIAKLAGNGYIEGYPDGNFGGDRLMTRYEFAAMLYRAIENGAALEEKIIKEFEPELGRIRVDRISGEDGDRNKIERVRVNDTKGERDHYGNKLAK